MSRSLRFGDDAREHLDAISSFIEENAGSDIADAFLAALTAKCAKLAALPGTLGTPRPELANNLRSTPHKGYVLYFVYDAKALEIIAILDARRDAVAYFTNDAFET